MPFLFLVVAGKIQGYDYVELSTVAHFFQIRRISLNVNIACRGRSSCNLLQFRFVSVYVARKTIQNEPGSASKKRCNFPFCQNTMRCYVLIL